MRRTALMFVLAGLVGALVATPLAVYASHQFSDVPDSNPFHDDISWLAEAEVTLGCGPSVFCPKDNVTREQMAAFMRRLAERTTPRIAFESVEDDFGHGERTASLSTLITAPAPGFLVMSAGVDVFNNTEVVQVNCWVDVDGDRVPGSLMASRIDGADSNISENCTTTGIQEVDAGSFTVEFVMDKGLVDTTTGFLEASLWVMWVPFDGAGNMP